MAGPAKEKETYGDFREGAGVWRWLLRVLARFSPGALGSLLLSSATSAGPAGALKE